MKKLLHFMFLLTLTMSFAQTPIYKWDFDGNMNNSGSATILPWTPSGTGTPSYVMDRLGQPNKAINLPNTLGYFIDILSGAMPAGNAPRTFSVWVKFVNDNDAKTYPVVGWGNAAPNQSFGFWRNGVQNSYYTWGSGNDYNIPQTNAQIQSVNNGWVHIAMTHNGTTLSTYYNGVNLGNYSRTLNTGNQNFTINRLVNASAGTGDAIQLDDLRIYNTGLTATQVADIYNQTSTAAPTVSNVSATNIGTTTATINYTVNANNAATNTEVRYAVSPGGTLVTLAGPNATGTTDTNFSVNLTGLTQNTTYEYNIRAVNSQGNTFSTALFFTTTSVGAPVISSVSVSNITSTTATVNFSLNSGGTAAPTTINYGTSATALTSTTQGPIVTSTNAAPQSVNLNALTPNTTYFYQVTSVNANGLASSSVNSFTTPALATAPPPIYHYKFSGNLNEENGGPALVLSPLTTLPFVFPSNSSLLLEKDNLNRTPFFLATLPNLPQGNASRTVSIRINFENGSLASNQNIFSWGTSVNNQAYGVTQEGVNNANHYFWGPTDFIHSNPISSAKWYTLTYVYDGSNVTIYKNGTLLQSTTRTLNTNGTTFRLGATPDQTVRFLHARVDDLQIYNTALTATQIASLNATLSSNDFNVNNLKFNLYPNPTSDILNIESENELKSVEIYSLQGQKVMSSKNNVINISDLASGLYLVQVIDIENITATKKLIIK